MGHQRERMGRMWIGRIKVLKANDSSPLYQAANLNLQTTKRRLLGGLVVSSRNLSKTLQTKARGQSGGKTPVETEKRDHDELTKAHSTVKPEQV